METKSWYAGLCALLLLLNPVAAYAVSISIAAVVGDSAITTTDVDDRVALMLAGNKIPSTVENQEKLRPRVLQTLIDETLQLQEAKRQSIIISDADVAKAIDGLSENNPQAGGDMRKYMAAQGLSVTSLENQLRAQLAWNKVVQRRLRRNVTISQDEILRVQQARAGAPAIAELRVAALSIPFTAPDKDADAHALATTILKDVRAGAPLPEMAMRYPGRVQFSPPSWIAESELPPTVTSALKGLQVGSYSEPLRAPNAYQIVQILERGARKQQSESTEMIVKQLTVNVPPKPDKKLIAALRDTAELLRKNPGNCEDLTLPQTPLPATAKFARTKLGQLGEPLRGTVEHLQVGQVSDPMVAPDAMRLVLLCERVESAAGSLPNGEEIRQQLFAEKLDLEAQKLMRNLRRDAYIDIKGQ